MDYFNNMINFIKPNKPVMCPRKVNNGLNLYESLYLGKPFITQDTVNGSFENLTGIEFGDKNAVYPTGILATKSGEIKVVFEAYFLDELITIRLKQVEIPIENYSKISCFLNNQPTLQYIILEKTDDILACLYGNGPDILSFPEYLTDTLDLLPKTFKIELKVDNFSDALSKNSTFISMTLFDMYLYKGEVYYGDTVSTEVKQILLKEYRKHEHKAYSVIDKDEQEYIEYQKKVNKQDTNTKESSKTSYTDKMNQIMNLMGTRSFESTSFRDIKKVTEDNNKEIETDVVNDLEIINRNIFYSGETFDLADYTAIKLNRILNITDNVALDIANSLFVESPKLAESSTVFSRVNAVYNDLINLMRSNLYYSTLYSKVDYLGKSVMLPGVQIMFRLCGTSSNLMLSPLVLRYRPYKEQLEIIKEYVIAQFPLSFTYNSVSGKYSHYGVSNSPLYNVFKNRRNQDTYVNEEGKKFNSYPTENQRLVINNKCVRNLYSVFKQRSISNNVDYGLRKYIIKRVDEKPITAIIKPNDYYVKSAVVNINVDLDDALKYEYQDSNIFHCVDGEEINRNTSTGGAVLSSKILHSNDGFLSILEPFPIVDLVVDIARIDEVVLSKLENIGLGTYDISNITNIFNTYSHITEKMELKHLKFNVPIKYLNRANTLATKTNNIIFNSTEDDIFTESHIAVTRSTTLDADKSSAFVNKVDYIKQHKMLFGSGMYDFYENSEIMERTDIPYKMLLFSSVGSKLGGTILTDSLMTASMSYTGGISNDYDVMKELKTALRLQYQDMGNITGFGVEEQDMFRTISYSIADTQNMCMKIPISMSPLFASTENPDSIILQNLGVSYAIKCPDNFILPQIDITLALFNSYKFINNEVPLRRVDWQ